MALARFQVLRELAGPLVERNARQALRVTDRAYVLETSRIAMAGPVAELADSPEVRRAYLGL